MSSSAAVSERAVTPPSRVWDINIYHVPVADGIRALSVGIVLWFHVWQQSWLSARIPVPAFLQALGMSKLLDFTFIPRSGFLFVEMLLMLSGFCLFLPHARAALIGETPPKLRDFALKRVARIVPSYYLCVFLIFFLVALPTGAYDSVSNGLKDLFSTLSFSQTAIMDTLLRTKINGVLWTAAVEMQFYVLFPLLAYSFRKHPIVTYLLMVGISAVYLYAYVLADPERIRYTINQLPGFLGVFANGMLAAYVYVFISQQRWRGSWLSAFSTVCCIAAGAWIVSMCKDAAGAREVQLWQASNRLSLSAVFALFLLSSSLSVLWLRFLLGNRMMRFLAGISYNVYIWHQWLAVQLKQRHIPYWEGDVLPNMLPDVRWQHAYTLLSFGAAILAGVFFTYFFERPIYYKLTGRREK